MEHQVGLGVSLLFLVFLLAYTIYFTLPISGYSTQQHGYCGLLSSINQIINLYISLCLIACCGTPNWIVASFSCICIS